MKLHANLSNSGPLTKRESDVLVLLCQGQLRKQIAGRLNRSYGCVSKQIESIAHKLNAHSTAEIVAKAVANQLVNITLRIWLLVALIDGIDIDYEINRRTPKSPRTPMTRHYSKQQTPRFQREI